MDIKGKKRTINKLVIALYCMIWCSALSSQTTATGKVVNENNEVLDMATVVLKDINDDIVSYAFSNNLGQFKIGYIQGAEKMCVNYLGYKEKCTQINKDSLKNIHIVLEISTEALKEVVVSEKYLPVTQKKDTTIFQVDSFRDSTEYNVEELLTKIPGISVESSGQIKWYNEPIKLILIEDSDILGNQYTVGSKNLRANTVKSIEIIENYSKNPILKNLKDSHETVINLKLREEFKNIIAGTQTVDGGFSNEAKYDQHLNAFYFNPQIKSLVLANNSNTGKGFDITNLGYMDETLDYRYLNRLQNNYIEMPHILPIGLDPTQYSNAHQLFNTLKHDIKISSGSQLKVNTVYQYFNDNQNTKNFTQNTKDAQIYTNEYSSNSSILNNLLSNELEYTLVKKKLFYDAKYAFTNVKNGGNTSIMNNGIMNTFDPLVKRHGHYTEHKLFLTLTQRMALIVQGNYQNISSSENAVFNSPDFVNFFLINNQKFTQNIGTRNESLVLKTDLLYKQNINTHEMGYMVSSDNLSNDLQYIFESTTNNDSTLLSEANLLTHKVYYKLQSKFNNKLTHNFHSSISNFHINDTLRQLGFDLSTLWKYKMTKNSHAIFQSSIGRSVADIQYLQQWKYIMDNYLVKEQISQNDLVQSYRNRVSYYYSEPISRFSASLRVQFNHINDVFILENNFLELLIVQAPLLTPYRTNFDLGGHVEKFISVTRSFVKLDVSQAYNTGFVQIQGDLTRFNGQSTRMYIKCDQWVNPYIKLNAQYTYTINNLNYEDRDQKSKINQHSFNISTHIKWKGWATELISRFQFSDVNGQTLHPIRFFSIYNSYVLYPNKPQPITLFLKLHNIFNPSKNENSIQSENFIFSNTVETIPFFITLGIDHNF